MRLLLAALFVASAAAAAAGDDAALDLRAFTIAPPAGWQPAPADEPALRERFAREAEPVLRELIATPPPVLLSVRAAAAARSADGGGRLVATWALLAGDAESAVLDLRDRDIRALQPAPRFEPATVAGRAATRFVRTETDGTLVFGSVFALPDRPDALALVALAFAAPAPADAGQQAAAAFASVVFGDHAARRRAAAERASFANYLRANLWESEGATEGLLFVRRIALMVVLFCGLFAGQLKLAQIFVQRRNAQRAAAGAAGELRSEKFILPIALVSITLTALVVSWFVTG